MRLNEFESEGVHRPGAKVGGAPLHFLVLKAQLVVLVSAFVMVSKVQFGQFLVCCSSTHGAPVFSNL